MPPSLHRHPLGEALTLVAGGLIRTEIGTAVWNRCGQSGSVVNIGQWVLARWSREGAAAPVAAPPHWSARLDSARLRNDSDVRLRRVPALRVPGLGLVVRH